jgi:signal transduction histidine kinase
MAPEVTLVSIATRDAVERRLSSEARVMHDPAAPDPIRQARLLETAYSIIQHAHGSLGSLSLEALVEGIVQNLVDIGGLEGAAISLDIRVDTLHLTCAARAGELRDNGEWTRKSPIFVRGSEVGELTTYFSSTQSIDDQSELLEFVLPTLLLGIENAVAFAEVTSYQRTLEHKVYERTAELAEAHRQLAQTVEDLRDAKAARDRFFANINHEIRTPLTLILLAVDGIARDRLGADTLQKLEEVKGGTNRLLHLVNSLLLLAAGDEGKLRVRPAPIDVAACLVRVVQGWQSAASRGQIQLEYVGPKECPATMDEAALETVVGNFVSNAVKFTPALGRITITLDASDAAVTIRVRDTGAGIDPEFVPKLFGRFERSASAATRGVRGTGIGLSLSKELVDLQRGSIEVIRHEDPRGASFVVTLPRHQAISATLPRDESHALVMQPEVVAPVTLAQAPRPQPSPAPEATIVLAEDDPELAQHMAELLADQYRVLIAPNGKAALELARHELPDLLVTDLDMPEMDGIELTREFLALQGTTLSPVLIVSAYAGLGERLAGFEAGAVDYVVKPFSGDELRARIRSQLAIRKLALKLHESQKLATVGLLSAGLAHELRNPANALVNALQPLLELLPPEQRMPDSPGGLLAEVAIEAANQIRERSRNILDYSRAERVSKRTESIRELIDRAKWMVSSGLERVEVREDIRLDTVPCAAPLIEQILVNLIDNATYAAGSGGWIEIAARVEGDLAIIEVSDSGPGVPPHLQTRIFDPFFTTKPIGQGTGLGLTICRRIALNHQGDLQMVRRGERTVFRLELPTS